MGDSVDKWFIELQRRNSPLLDDVKALLRAALADPVLVGERLAEAKRDTERLDWLLVNCPMQLNVRGTHGREAIDAAMSSQAAPGKQGGQP